MGYEGGVMISSGLVRHNFCLLFTFYEGYNSTEDNSVGLF